MEGKSLPSPFLKVLSSSSFHGQICSSVAAPPSNSTPPPPHIHLLPLRRPDTVHRLPLKLESPPIPTADLPTSSTVSTSVYHRKLTRKRRKGTSSRPTDVLRLMDALGLPVDPEIYDSLIKECMASGDYIQGMELQRHLRRSRLKSNQTLLNKLLLMNVSLGDAEAASQLFDEMPDRDFLSWAILITGYMEMGDYEESITLFVEMFYCSGILKIPSFIPGFILNACAYTMNVELGKQVHAWILKVGHSDNVPVPSCLINFYGKLRDQASANVIFNQASKRDKYVWTNKIISSCRTERFEEVVEDFREMCREGKRMNSYTITSVLRACSLLKDECNCGKQIHANSIKVGLDRSEFVERSLVEMYAKIGLLEDARRICDSIMGTRETEIDCWNAMVKGCIENACGVAAIKLLYEMRAKGLQCEQCLVDEVRILMAS